MQRIFPSAAAGEEPLPIYDEVELPQGPPERPYVVVNMVTTLDGKITLQRGQAPERIGSRTDRLLMDRIRSLVDAVIYGAESIRQHGVYTGVPAELEPLRTRRGLTPQPLAVVATRTCDLPVDRPYFTQAPRPPLVLTAASAPAPAVDRVRSVASVEVIGNEHLDLPRALSVLRAKYGVIRLLLEGGARLNHSFFDIDAVDELFWTVAPKIAGWEGDLSMVEGPHLFQPSTRMELVTAYHHEGELFLRYRTVR